MTTVIVRLGQCKRRYMMISDLTEHIYLHLGNSSYSAIILAITYPYLLLDWSLQVHYNCLFHNIEKLQDVHRNR